MQKIVAWINFVKFNFSDRDSSDIFLNNKLLLLFF